MSISTSNDNIDQSQQSKHPSDDEDLVSPPTMVSTLLPPGEHNVAALADAINKMHATMITHKAQLAEKMEGRFTSLESQLANLHEWYEKQEASFCGLSRGMAKQSDLNQVEGTLNNIARQADPEHEK